MLRDEARAAALLDRRTMALATRPPRGGAQAPQLLQARIVWSLGDSLYAIDVAAVAAVIPFAGCALVPTREAACLGVIGRAGRFYSVIGLRRLLGVAEADAGGGRPGHLLLLRSSAPYLALAVDRVLGRFDLPAEGPAPEIDGRLVALFDPAARLAALGHSLGV
jgi:chemotaxis signal transduction protein